MSSYKSLMDQIATLEEQAAKLMKAEREAAIADIKRTMQVHGVSIDDLRTKRGPRKPRSV